MENQTRQAIDAFQTGVQQLSGLAVTYAFSVLGAIILLLVGYFLAGVIERALKSAIGRVPGFDQTLAQFFAKIGRYVVLALFIVMVLGQFGVQTASIIAAIGAIGLAVGLALQGTLQNIAAGLMLLALRPLRVGEYIEAGAVKGTVEDIGLFATRLRTIEGVYILAPNSTLWSEPVYNFNRNKVRRNDLVIGIGYDDDIDLAQKTMLDLAAKDKRILRDPAPSASVSELGASSVSVTLRYWTSAADYLTTRFDMTKAAKLAFDEKGISIPFPQQEIVYREMAKQRAG